MADVKWSDNTAFPVVSSPLGSDEIVGLFSSANGKTTINDIATTINVTLQVAYNNGSSGQQGSINLNVNNLNPIASFNSYNAGNQEHFTAINSASSSPTLWGYGFRAQNSLTNYKDFAHIYANVENNTSGSESGSLGLYASSLGTLTQAMLIDGANQLTSSIWPMVVQNGARIYQTTELLTGNITYSGTNTGGLLLSDDLAVHNITINNYFSTNGDDSFTVQTQGSNTITLTPSGGVTINGSGSVFTIPINTRATVQLVNAGSKAYVVTIESIPQSPVAFNAYASSTQNNVTGNGTTYTVIFDTQSGTTSPDFNTSTGVFTAPITGFYQFSASVTMLGVDTNNTNGELYLTTTTENILIAYDYPFPIVGGSGALIYNGSTTAFLNSGDTAQIQLKVSGEATPNVYIYGESGIRYTFFSGSYVQPGVGGGANGKIDVTDDNSTNATMYPVWVTGNSGAQPTFVSSTELTWNPATKIFQIGNSSSDNVNVNCTSEVIFYFNRQNSSHYSLLTFHDIGAGQDEWYFGQWNDATQNLILKDVVFGSNVIEFIGGEGKIQLPLLTAGEQLWLDGSKNIVTLPTFNGAYTPTLTAVSNVGTLSLVKAFAPYVLQVSGSVGTATVQFTCVPSGGTVAVRVDCPVTTNFSSANQCAFVGGSVVNNGTVDPGIIYDVTAQNGTSQANVLLTIPIGSIGQTYTVNVTFTFQIQ